MERIDLVVPYVDSSDPNWQKLFNEYNPLKDKKVEGINADNRFRGQGLFFRFFFRGVEKFLPWIGTIHLLVQSETQVPNWINRDNVHIVVHEQFIPKEFLPTFNSTTIEMFLWNIPGLSEKFIYANDDMFITKTISKDLLYQDYKSITNVFSVTRLDTIYYNQVDNSYKEIYRHLQPDIITVGHSIRPYFKSDMIACFNEHKDNILKSITPFRSTINFNVYLFSYDLMRKDKLITKSNVSCLTTNGITNVILSTSKQHHHIICIQDVDLEDNNIYETPELIKCFKQLLPTKSKYENPNVYSDITQEQLDRIECIVSKLPSPRKEKVKASLLRLWSI